MEETIELATKSLLESKMLSIDDKVLSIIDKINLERKKAEEDIIKLILEAHDRQDSITFAIWLNKLNRGIKLSFK